MAWLAEQRLLSGSADTFPLRVPSSAYLAASVDVAYVHSGSATCASFGGRGSFIFQLPPSISDTNATLGLTDKKEGETRLVDMVPQVHPRPRFA